MLLTVGSQAVLFGADLEQVSNPDKGWSAVVTNRRGRKPLAHVFKVPHHGSSNAHSEDVWKEMMVAQPKSVVTPMLRGRNKLPLDSDVMRLKQNSSELFITSRRLLSQKSRYPQNVTKMVKATGNELVPAAYSDGRVTMRWMVHEPEPNVELWGAATLL